MAKVYLESTDTSFIVNNSNTVVYGANGAQTITVASGVTNVIADQNVEKVVFSGATNDYTYAQIGNQMGVYKDGTLVTTIPLQGDSDGTQFQFSNGTTNAMLTSGVMTIGGGSVSSTPTSVTMTDTAITKTTTTTTTPTTPADTGGGGGGDTTAPTLSSSTPTDNATAVAIGANIVLTLNETVTAVTGKNIYIKTTTGDTTVATIDAASSQVTISGGVVTINPTADLSASTEYYVLVESGAFKDAANNVYTGISSTTALSFTTATPTPAITYSGTTFAEAAANDGSITANVTLTLANDTFTGINGNALTGAVVTNVPTGLTAVVTKTSDTVATVTFTGAATNHANANDIANLTITLGNTAFTGGSAAAVTNATKSDLVIDFADAPDTTPPTVSSFGITTTTVTATLTTDTGTIGLYTSGTTLATGVTAGTITNTTTGAVTAVAQSSVATVTAKVLDTANNEATNTQSVILGTTGSDAITETIFNQFIFGFGGADTFTLKDGNTGSVLPIIADYAVNTSGESIAFGGTAAAWTTAVTDWTITNGVATKTGATSSDFYTDFIAATGAVGEVVAFVDGGTFLFGEGASNADTDNTAVVLVGVQATAVATSAGATTVLIA